METTPNWTGNRVRESSREKMRCPFPNTANQSLAHQKSTTERGWPSLYIMNHIRQNMALRNDAPDLVNLNGVRCWKDTEDSDGLTKKKTLTNRESSGTKAHFTEKLPVYPLRDGLTQGQTERLEKWRNLQVHTPTKIWIDRVQRGVQTRKEIDRCSKDKQGLETVANSAIQGLHSTDRQV